MSTDKKSTTPPIKKPLKPEPETAAKPTQADEPDEITPGFKGLVEKAIQKHKSLLRKLAQ